MEGIILVRACALICVLLSVIIGLTDFFLGSRNDFVSFENCWSVSETDGASKRFCHALLMLLLITLTCGMIGAFFEEYTSVLDMIGSVFLLIAFMIIISIISYFMTIVILLVIVLSGMAVLGIFGAWYYMIELIMSLARKTKNNGEE